MRMFSHLYLSAFPQKIGKKNSFVKISCQSEQVSRYQQRNLSDLNNYKPLGLWLQGIHTLCSLNLQFACPQFAFLHFPARTALSGSILFQVVRLHDSLQNVAMVLVRQQLILIAHVPYRSPI